MQQQKLSGLEIVGLIVGLLLIGGGVVSWFSQYWTFDFDFEIGDSKTAVAKHESAKLAVAGCQSNNDCDLGLECFRGECSYPCRGALMCPIGMACDTATDYCEGISATECPDYGPDICDGLDNDCDGVIDKGCSCILGSTFACSTGFSGICSVGQTICLSDGRIRGVCEPMMFPQREICGDGIDNNCDGLVDENCP